jgi:hypothetical protein
MEHTNNHKIILVKGHDKNNLPFSAFVLVSNEEDYIIKTSTRVDLTKYNIIYKMYGHKVNPQIFQMIKEYLDKFNS